MGCGASCLAGPALSEDSFVDVRAQRQDTASSRQSGPSLAVAVSSWEGPAAGGDGHPPLRSPTPPPVRTGGGRRSEDFRETPRLVVDSLQGNVFVNQYLVIKELGRGAHGSVKLVFDTEQQLVHAMKVIHRKAVPGCARRRNSLNLTDRPVLCTTTAAAATAPTASCSAPLAGLQRHHSLSADSCQLARAGVVAGGLAGFGRSNSVSPSPGCRSPVKADASFSAAAAGGAVGASQSAQPGDVTTPPAASAVMSWTDAAVAAGVLKPAANAASSPSDAALDSTLLRSPELGQQAPSETLQLLPSLSLSVLRMSSLYATSSDVQLQVALGAAAAAAAPQDAAWPATPPAASRQSSASTGVASRLSFTAMPAQAAAGVGAGAAALPGGASGRASPAPVPIAAAVDATTSELAREIAVMQRLNHPNVVKLFEVIHDPEQRLLIMVMEFMPGGPILSSSRVPGQTTEPLPEPAARMYFRELVSAVDYLHANLIMHGDLKPDNLLLSADGRLTISDFGSATVLPHKGTLMTTTMGTPAFMAPEMCGLRSAPFAPFPAEVWAVGACLFMFVYGRVPYVAASTGALYEAIRSPEPVALPSQPPISAQLAHLLSRLLDKDPSTRMRLVEVLSHEWVTDSGKLPPLQHYAPGQAASAAEDHEEAPAKERTVLTALKKQVKTAVPNVEERTYKKGALLVQQGKVPEGLFLILSGTCELVLLSHLPEPLLQQQQQQAGGHSSGKSSFTSKIAAAVVTAGGGGRDSPTLLRTQSSSPMFAAPPRRDADLDFAGALSDSDDTTDSNEEEQGGWGGCGGWEAGCGGGSGSGSQQWCAAAQTAATRQQQQQHDEAMAMMLDPSAAIQPGFPFFRLTASADGARRPQLVGGSGMGRPWSPSLGAQPPPIQQHGREADAAGGSGFFSPYGSSSTAVGATPGQLHSWSADGGSPVFAATLAGAGPAAAGTGPLSVDGALTAQCLSASGGQASAEAGTGSTGGTTPRGRRASHVKSCSVDFGLLVSEEPKLHHHVQSQRSGSSLLQHKAAAAAAATSRALSAGLQRLQGLRAQLTGGRAAAAAAADGSLSSHDRPPGSPYALTYDALAQASAPNLGDAGAAGSAGGMFAGSPVASVLVQRSTNSAVMGGRVYHRAVRRSESMHKRMVDLVAAAKMRTQTNSKRQELVGIRGPGQMVGDTNLSGKPAPAAATVRARSRMRVLLVRSSDAAALVTQPTIKAALYRTQTESSVLDALETFAAYDGEVSAIDEVRRSRAASFAAAARGAGLLLLGSGGSGMPPQGGSGQWGNVSGLMLATASSAGSSALESYGSMASSLASFTSGHHAAAAAAAGGLSLSLPLPVAAGRSSPLPLALPLSTQSSGSFSLPPRMPSQTAGAFGAGAAAVAAEMAAALGSAGGGPRPPQALALGAGAPQGGGSNGGSPLRPGSRGTSFTAGSTTPRGQQQGLRGTSSRLGLSVQTAAQLGGAGCSPLNSPRG